MTEHHHHHSGLFPAREHTGIFWKDHSLSLILITIMVVQTLYAIWSGHYVWTHELPFEPSDPNLESNGPWSLNFWVWWSWEYNVSLVADTFGVLLVVLLSKWFREKGSAESS